MRLLREGKREPSSFAGGRGLGRPYGVEQVTDGAVGLQGVAQGEIPNHGVAVAAPLFFRKQCPGVDEFVDDALHRPLGDADLFGHFAHALAGIPGETNQDVTVIAEKGPGMRCGNHEFYFANLLTKVKKQIYEKYVAYFNTRIKIQPLWRYRMNESPAAPCFASSEIVPVCIARGDGIGPEIMDATLRILEAAGARLDFREIRIGKSVYEEGISSGMEPSAWEVIRSTGVMLKAPITTPQGGGVKSLNVTLRKTLGLYANIRPNRAYAPFVPTHHPEMDVVIVRENEEDTYAGIEHRQTEEVTQCLKLITRPGCERLIRYAFAHARALGRRRVTCMTKDNIMKLTDGLFHRVFDEVAADYPDLEAEHMIIDIGAARLARNPAGFDVIVAPNLYGDILSDIAAEVAGSVGLVGSANLGRKAAMFEAIHGSAPDIAGQNKANPSALLKAAILMLGHVGQGEIGARIENAWLCTLEDGVHTADIASGLTRSQVGTREFAAAVIERLGRAPQRLAEAQAPASASAPVEAREAAVPPAAKRLEGVDVFLDWEGAARDPAMLGPALEEASTEALRLRMITNRGVKVYPGGHPETFCTDHWRCRFQAAEGREPEAMDPVHLQFALVARGFKVIKTENLYAFDGHPGYSLGQGQ